MNESEKYFTTEETPTTDGPVTENITEETIADAVTPRVDEQGRVNTEVPANAAPGDIVYTERYLDGEGKPQEKVHGPMPVTDWADYSRANGF